MMNLLLAALVEERHVTLPGSGLNVRVRSVANGEYHALVDLEGTTELVVATSVEELAEILGASEGEEG